MVRIFLMLFLSAILGGCTMMGRIAYMHGDEALPAQSFKYRDGGESLYYSFTQGDPSRVDTALFFYGGTGCPSWKSVMPHYVEGLSLNARVFALNKRFVADRSLIFLDCGKEFHLANHPQQWVHDEAEFIAAQIAGMRPRPRNIVLAGVSEGALIATRVAGVMPEVTHLAIIGSGGYSMRRSLTALRQKGAIWFDVDAGWEDIRQDPRSIEKSWYGNRYRWWSDIMDIDPLADFLKLDIPVLVGIGEADASVPVDSARYLESQFRAAGKANLELQVYPGANHQLAAGSRSFRPDFFQALSRLITSSEAK